MQFNITIEALDRFARENTFLSLMILAILGNLLYDVFKKLMYFFAVFTKYIAKSTGRSISKWNIKNIEYLIKNNKEDIANVEKVIKKDPNTYYKLLHELYNNLSILFIIIIINFIVLRLDNPIVFYSVLGSTLRYLISIFASIYYNTSLFENANNFNNYKEKKEKRIKLLERLLEK